MRSRTESFIINPYIAGSPVKNPKMFFGRDDVYAWLRQHLRGRFQDNVIILYGERRSGKTSVLYQMNERLDDPLYIPILIDLQSMAMEGIDGFMWEVARKIVRGLRGVEGLPVFDRPVRRDFEENPQHHFEDEFLTPILAALDGRHILLLFDEVIRIEEKIASGDLPASFINYLRSLAQFSNQLNFLFSIGDRVENITHLAELFNIGVYRKISFLDRDFAEDLITRPVKQHYTYNRDAIDRILEFTSGHTYYTQLLCHNIFSHWVEHQTEVITAEIVDSVLENVIEQATPNLQFTWDDATPPEKVIMSSLAGLMPQYRAGVMRRNLESSLKKAELFTPGNDITTGLKRLFERDIINRQEPYRFRVGFLQYWLAEYKPLEWVHEEIADAAATWKEQEERRLEEAPTTAEKARQWAAPVLTGVLMGGLVAGLLLWFAVPPPPEDDLSAEATLEAQLATAQADLAAAYSSGDSEEIEAAQVRAVEAEQVLATIQFEATASAEEAIEVQITALADQAAMLKATEIALQEQLAFLEEEVNKPPPPTPPPPEPRDTNTPPPPEDPPTSTPEPPPTSTNTSVPPTPVPPTATPLPSPEGLLAIAIDNNRGQYDTHIFDVVTGNREAVITGAHQPSFSPDGEQIAVRIEGNGNDGIWIFDRDGQNGEQINGISTSSRPDWSPDGRDIVFENRSVPKDGRTVWRIFVQKDALDNDDEFADRLAGDIFDADRPLYPVWGANNTLLFSACNYWFAGSGSRCGVWRTSSSATLLQTGFQLPGTITVQQEVATDYDGEKLLIMGRTSGQWDVYLGTIEAGLGRNLTDDPSDDGLAIFSPDGQWIAFVSDRGGQWGVWVIPADGSGTPRRLPIDGLGFLGGSKNWTTERIAWGFK